MTVVGTIDGSTLWIVALGIGALVVLIVIVLMVLLLRYLKNIEASAARLVALGGHVEANTANVQELAAAAPALEDLLGEAQAHAAILARHAR